MDLRSSRFVAQSLSDFTVALSSFTPHGMRIVAVGNLTRCRPNLLSLAHHSSVGALSFLVNLLTVFWSSHRSAARYKPHIVHDA